MNEVKEINTTELTQILKLAISQDAEIKKAILNDPQAVSKILQANLIDEIKQDLKIQKLILKYDYPTERDHFLNSFQSEHTRSGYLYALNDFENYCKAHSLETPIGASTTIVDNWILDQRKENKAPATISRNCGAVSSFFSYIERKSNLEIKNPIRGTKAKPKKTPTKKAKFYSFGNVDINRLERITQDINTIIEYEKNKELKAIIIFMAFRGLRCGSFENMTIHAEQFRTISKGEEYKGELPAICLQAVKDAEIKHNQPFSLWSSNRVKQAVKNHIKKLYDAGKLNYKYSAHDFRHYFAISEYTRDKDIYRLSKLLNHSGIAVTETYLKGLNVEI